MADFWTGWNAAQAPNTLRAAQEAQQLGQAAQFITMQNAMRQGQQAEAEAPIRSELLRAQVDEHRGKAAKLKRMDAMAQQVMGGEADKMSPDELEKVGRFLAMGEHPGAATILGIADKRRKMQDDASTMTSLRSQTVADAPAETEPEAIERVRAATEAGQPASVGFGENPNVIPRKDGGMFAPLMASPNKAIAMRAKLLQEAMDKSGERTDPQFWIKQADGLASQNAAFQQQQALLGQRGDQAQAGREFALANRPPPASTQPRAPVGMRFTGDGSLERIPVVGTTVPSDDGLENDAWYSIINGKARPGSLPIGRDEGNQYRAQLRSKIDEIAKRIGLTPERLATLGPENRSKFVALSALEKDLAAIRPFEKMLDTNVNVAIDLAKKIERTDSAFLNKPITWLMQNSGDNPDIAEYLFQIQTVKTEGARILNNPRLVGQLTDSARTEMGEVINGNMPLGQTERVLKRMLSDGRNRVKAIEDETRTLRSDIRGSAGTPQGPTKEPAEIENAVKAAGYAYEPDKYDYRVGAGGRVQRAAKQ